MSLRRLLAAQRGIRNEKNLPPLSQRQILAWADAYHRRTGNWPTHKSGVIDGADGETWLGVDSALRRATRGLRGSSSAAQLLAKFRGVRNPKGLASLTEDQIVAWADAHYRRTGRWPQVASGAVVGGGGQTWVGIEVALQRGKRGLPGGSSLARLLLARRGVPIWGRV
jgi:hypothetical protein